MFITIISTIHIFFKKIPKGYIFRKSKSKVKLCCVLEIFISLNHTCNTAVENENDLSFTSQIEEEDNIKNGP